MCDIVVKRFTFALSSPDEFLFIIHSYGSAVRECCNDDDQCQWERPKFDPPPHLNPLTDRQQNLPTWLRRGYLPYCKISSRSDKGFRFCACAISRIKLSTRTFVWFFWFFRSSTEKIISWMHNSPVYRLSSVMKSCDDNTNNKSLSFAYRPQRVQNIPYPHHNQNHFFYSA